MMGAKIGWGIGIGDWMGAKGVCILHNYSLLISEM